MAALSIIMIKVIHKSFALVWLWYASIILCQCFWGGLEIPVDGVMEIVFPYIFYSDSAWYDAPKYSKYDFIGNIKIVTFLAVMYSIIKGAMYYRARGSKNA
ncbi:hypothetical protein [Agarilytica rhodophyticola]|uniref:hypothetical protein n=1 Tax=Agarilytica rhodophyticola TaxID=1737490 RepID=UPI000B342B9C|nr:hypothetical protein [Agarilytica rhodophyticola]